LGLNQLEWLTRLHNTLRMGNYGKGTLRNYCMEMRLLFQYHHSKEVEDITADDITQYMLFIKSVHEVGRAKCRSVAQSCAFFFKHVLIKPFVLPSRLYPRKDFVLPQVMRADEVKHLLCSINDIRQYAAVSLLYGTGIRISELANIRFSDIERANNRLLVRQGKGNKDRYVLLPKTALSAIEDYYRVYRPRHYLFESKQHPGRAMHPRTMQTIVRNAMTRAGFKKQQYTAHTLRHSFATHLLDNGNDIHTIKTLLGHAKIETTMVYLHLQQGKRDILQSPIDKMFEDGKA
jgi:integrase/recombinase XerD